MNEFVRRSIDIETPDGKGKVAVVEFGPQDRPIDVVFSHANGFNAFTYRHILGPLTGLRILAYDLRGHGRTTLPLPTGERSDWSDLGRDLTAVLDRLELTHPVALSGHSFGATVSLMAARDRPAAVKALALFDPVLFANPPGTRAINSPLVEGALKRRARFDGRQAALERWYGRGAFATWPNEMVDDYVVDGLLEDGDGVRLACTPQWEASSYMAQGQNGIALLLETRRPTAVLKAEHNSTCNVAVDDARVAANPLIDLKQIAGTSHFLPMERPDLVRAAITAAARL